MSDILAELFTALGLVLCAGEFIQGPRNKWFNRRVEHLITALLPTRIFFRKRNPFFVAKGILRFQGPYVVGSLVVPVVFFGFAILAIGSFTQFDYEQNVKAIREAIEKSTNPIIREKAYAALMAVAQDGIECVPLAQAKQE